MRTRKKKKTKMKKKRKMRGGRRNMPTIGGDPAHEQGVAPCSQPAWV